MAGVRENSFNAGSWSASTSTLAPSLISVECQNHLEKFFQNPTLLALATESSSHPSGLEAVYGEPYMWAGGGLGNMDECPLQTCLATTGLEPNALNFATVCVVPECNASDLASKDFVPNVLRLKDNATDSFLGQSYAEIFTRSSQVQEFMGSAWVCGELDVPIKPVPFVFCIATLLILCLCALNGTLLRRQSGTHLDHGGNSDAETETSSDEEEREDTRLIPSTKSKEENQANHKYVFWKSFDAFTNFRQLFDQRSEATSFLDGLRACSLLMILLGHTASNLSVYPGFTNPSDLLPPSGFSSTAQGEFIISANFAVDTFFIISGFLIMHVHSRNLDMYSGSSNFVFRYLCNLPKLILHRLFRIIPLYAMCLLLFTQVAPQMGDGPFWYVWKGVLKPCQEYWWTNLLFVSNFIPFENNNANQCVFSYWYLSVDMQLFIPASFLLFWYDACPRQARRATVAVLLASCIACAVLAGTRGWSTIAFDGAAAVRFHEEAYTKPHLRVQSYLTGQLVAMLLPPSVLRQRTDFTLKHHALVWISIFALCLVIFSVGSGGISQRPCLDYEWPTKDDCGSSWPAWLIWLYASTCHVIWNSSIGLLMYLFLGRPANVSIVSKVLSSRKWVILSKLSFGAYLIHPMVVYIMGLRARNKLYFQPSTLYTNFIQQSVVTFAITLMLTLVVELPLANLCKAAVRRKPAEQNPPQQELSFTDYYKTDKYTRAWRAHFEDP